MADHFKKIGDYISVIDNRNTDGSISKLMGISIDKCYIPSVANVIGTDLNNYKVIRKGQFACSLMQVSRDQRIPIAMYRDVNPAIMSPAYVMFEVTRPGEILPEYMELWFIRSEFDREASFYAVGGVRGSLDWEDFCNMRLPVPSIDEQRKIVHDYQIFIKRIAVLQKTNETLEAVAATYFCDSFSKYGDIKTLPDGWRLAKLSDLCDVRGGKRLPADSELSDLPTKHPYIRVRDISNDRYVCLTDQCQYIDDDTYKEISRYTVNTGDLVISIVGTIGLIGKIHRSLDGANLTENCVKLTSIHSVSSDYLYYTLQYKKQNKEIDLLTVGAVQAKLPIYNIQSMKILVPPVEVLKEFQNIIEAINQTVEANMLEIQKMKQLATLLLSNITEGA